jgi:putative heme-binding domain-containing protein
LRLLGERRDPDSFPALRELAASPNEVHALRGLWGLYAAGGFNERLAATGLHSKSAARRLWNVRLLGEAGAVSAKMLALLTELARSDPAPEVRLQLASTARRLTKQDVLPLLHNLMQHKEDARDPCLPLMLWLAYEPRLLGQRDPALEWLRTHAAGNALVTDSIVPRTLRRLAAAGRPEDLAACVAFLEGVKDSLVRRRALEGLAAGLQNRQFDAPERWKAVVATLLADPDGEVQRLARRLAVNFRDREAVRRALAVVRESAKSAAERRDAVRDLALARPPEAQRPLLDIVLHDRDTGLRCEACRALAGYDSADIARVVLGGWKSYPPVVRVETVNLLAGRKDWAQALLAAVGRKDVPRTDLTDNTILRIRGFKDKRLNQQIEAVWGRFRDTPAELNALINKMRGELYAGPASFERGRKVFENQCAKCHKFEGRGHTVGPELDGAARDIEYLLVNVLDPNRVVGAPYFVRQVVLKSGRIETGLLAAEDEQSITLKAENDARKVIQKKDIDELTVQQKSVMPEGLAGAMTVQDFRDLIRYVMANPFLTNVEVAGPEKAWKKPVVGVPGRIPLPAARGAAVAYVRAEVTAPAALRTRLQLGAAQEVEVRLNDKLVYKGKPGGKTAEPDQASVVVELMPGKNRLLFRVSYQGGGALYARLLDPQRKLRYPEAGSK